ncbi:hypothetical protein BH23GEM11_BH23GEM11_13830 [soil metagenome]
MSLRPPLPLFAARLLPGLLGLLLVAGCGVTPPPPASEVLEALPTGAPRGDVLVALPVGPRIGDADRLIVGYERDRYLVEGQTVEVLWVRRGSDGPLVDLPRHDVNPVIFHDEHLDGWGWDHFERRAGEWSLRDRLIPAAPRAPAPEPETDAPGDAGDGADDAPGSEAGAPGSQAEARADAG